MKLKFNLRNHLTSKNLVFWLIGFLAFVWVLIRSGLNPKRLTYPCQQTAYPLASAWMVAIIGATTGTVILKKIFKISIPLVAIIVSSWFLISSTNLKQQITTGNYPTWESAGALSNIFMFDNIPATSGSLAAGNASVPNSSLSDPGVDSLIAIMASRGLFLNKSAAHTNGIVGSGDVVIIKANFQWRHRLGTNTDRIKGVIWQILNHPDGFTGEILVCDNTNKQIWPENWLAGFNDYSNNSDDLDQCIVDVVSTFKDKGYPVNYYIWDNLNNSIVTEYSEGNITDGYVYNSTTKTSYPKFQTPNCNYVSLRYGLWNSSSKTYDRDKLTIINFPVLKAHGMAGATISLKNYIGVMNTTKANSWFGGADVDAQFHPNYCFSEYALVARQIDLCWPDLNIVDATWVAPASNYDFNLESIKVNTILASTDPVAIDWYASKYILTPIANIPENTNPEFFGNKFHGTILNHWYNYLKNNTSRTVTKDPSKISVYGKGSIVASTLDNGNAINNNNLKIYPNPSVSGVYSISGSAAALENGLNLVGSNGALLEKIAFKGNKFELDLSNYPSGIYYLQYFENKQKKSEKLIHF